MLYFIQDSVTDHLKIGFVKATCLEAVEVRRADLQIGNPSELLILATTPGSMADEQELHRRFERYHVRGEWFRPCNAILRFILEANASSVLWHEFVPTVIRPEDRAVAWIARQPGRKATARHIIRARILKTTMEAEALFRRMEVLNLGTYTPPQLVLRGGHPKPGVFRLHDETQESGAL